MEIIIKPYHALPCELQDFTINGIQADKNDFGFTQDSDRENAPEYGCGWMEFTSIMPTNEVLEKYNITLDEYNQICEQLESKLCVGTCGWCI